MNNYDSCLLFIISVRLLICLLNILYGRWSSIRDKILSIALIIRNIKLTRNQIIAFRFKRNHILDIPIISNILHTYC